MKNLIFVTLLLSLFLTGCKNETLKVKKIEVDESNTIIVPVTTKPRGTLELQAIADSVRFVRLDNADEALIGNVSYVHFIDSLMFVLDGGGRAILVFDNAGNFKYKIFKRGGGPGEYQSIMRLMVDDIKKQLIVYDQDLRKMIFYDFQGETIKEINRFNDRNIFRGIINLPNGHFLCYRDDYEEGYDTRGLWETDSLGNLIRYLLKPTEVYPHITRGAASYLYQLPDNKIGLMSSENEIYHYENDTLKKFITYKPDGINVLNFPGRQKVNEKYNYMYSIYEKNNYVLTEWHNENLKSYFNLYSCTDKSTTTFGAIDYEFADFAFIGHRKHSNLTNVLLLSCPGTMVNQLLHDNTLPLPDQLKNRIRALTSGMSDEEIEDMNPILEIVYLKQNGEIPARYKQH